MYPFGLLYERSDTEKLPPNWLCTLHCVSDTAEKLAFVWSES